MASFIRTDCDRWRHRASIDPFWLRGEAPTRHRLSFPIGQWQTGNRLRVRRTSFALGRLRARHCGLTVERGGERVEYCCTTLTEPLPKGEVSARFGGFTWMHLSACVPHAQAGRMVMDVSHSMRYKFPRILKFSPPASLTMAKGHGEGRRQAFDFPIRCKRRWSSGQLNCELRSCQDA